MPTKTTSRSPSSTACRRAAPVKSPTSTKQTSGSSGSIRIAAFSVRPPVARTSVGSPCAAMTDTACTTEARHDSVENGRTTPVVPRMLMPPRMPSRALVVFLARCSPSGTLMVTRTPRDAEIDDGSDVVADHLARDRVDGRPADLEAQPRLGDDADADTAAQVQPGARPPSGPSRSGARRA